MCLSDSPWPLPCAKIEWYSACARFAVSFSVRIIWYMVFAHKSGFAIVNHALSVQRVVKHVWFHCVPFIFMSCAVVIYMRIRSKQLVHDLQLSTSTLSYGLIVVISICMCVVEMLLPSCVYVYYVVGSAALSQQHAGPLHTCLTIRACMVTVSCLTISIGSLPHFPLADFPQYHTRGGSGQRARCTMRCSLI